MSQQITFGSVVIYDSADGGIGWSFMPGVVDKGVPEERMAGAKGVLFRDVQESAATHVLELDFRVSDVNGPRAALLQARRHLRVALTVPGFGSYARCSIADAVAKGPARRGDGLWFVGYVVTLRQSAV